MDSTAQMGTDSPWRLLVRFSLPSIVGMVVNAMYNIVDRMFIGYGVGTLGIAAVTISFPIMMAMMAFSILVGVGANTLFSIRMGEGRKQDAERILGNAFSLLFFAPLIVSVFILFQLDPILRLIGTSEWLLPYARTYARIILYGSALSSAAHGLSHFIRSDGHPQISMISMLIGGIVNTILDPLFIFVFNWGITGAAWATVIAQTLSFAWCMAYFLSPRANIRLHRRNLRLDLRHIVLPFLILGFTPFVMNLANSLLNVVLNRSLHRYGGENAVAVMGILMAYMSIIFMPTFGITQGIQPLMGYNYGANKYSRVRIFFRLSVQVTTVLMCAGWVMSQLFPTPILRMFVPADSELIPIGIRALRIFTIAFPVVAFQIMTSTLFQAIGKPIQAGFPALSRQLLFFIPFLFLFPPFFGLDGVYLAAPASDLLSFTLTVFLARHEMKRLHALEKQHGSHPPVAFFDETM
jgi:putative MATE family efflux protein